MLEVNAGCRLRDVTRIRRIDRDDIQVPVLRRACMSFHPPLPLTLTLTAGCERPVKRVSVSDGH